MNTQWNTNVREWRMFVNWFHVYTPSTNIHISRYIDILQTIHVFVVNSTRADSVHLGLIAICTFWTDKFLDEFVMILCTIFSAIQNNVCNLYLIYTNRLRVVGTIFYFSEHRFDCLFALFLPYEIYVKISCKFSNRPSMNTRIIPSDDILHDHSDCKALGTNSNNAGTFKAQRCTRKCIYEITVY